jgi:hypothetical protein
MLAMGVISVSVDAASLIDDFNDINAIERPKLVSDPISPASALLRINNAINNTIYVNTINRMRIEFDPSKDAANKAKHGLSLALAADL